ncbi:MAG TPA: hypothetical protein VL988_03915 [Solirubrobacteraceae bacterium]|nr:hypothetical protein [Solirubrobacteraceae bacterium]
MNRKKLIAVLVAACAIAISVAAIAQGSSATKTKQSASKAGVAGSAPAGAPPGGTMGGMAGGPGGGAVHSVAVVPNKAGTSFVTVTSDRGKAQSVDANSGAITIAEGTKSATYKTVTLTIGSEATVMLDGKKASLAEIKAEDDVSVSSSSEGTTVFATDSSFKPSGPGGAGHPGMAAGTAGPPPGAEGTGAEAKPSTGSATTTE